MKYTPEIREGFRQRALAAMQRRPVDPTPEEIAAACEEIQQEWSEVEERSRRPKPRRWSLQELRTLDYCES